MFLDNSGLLMVICKLSKINYQSRLYAPHISLQQDRFLKKKKEKLLLSFSHDYWKQKSKTNYLHLGDANTRYYHTHALIRRSRNQIKCFTTVLDQIVSAPNEISNAITKEFEQQFVSNPDCGFDEEVDFQLLSPIVSDEDNMYLGSDVSSEEIKLAVFLSCSG